MEKALFIDTICGDRREIVPPLQILYPSTIFCTPTTKNVPQGTMMLLGAHILIQQLVKLEFVLKYGYGDRTKQSLLQLILK